MKHEGMWKNIVTGILPLHVSDVHTPKEKVDYGNFVIIEDIISLDKLKKQSGAYPKKVI
jgi:hypothetical protein